jgi:transposase
MGRLPEAWIAPPAVRELRELVRHRAKLVHARTSLRCQVHAVLAGQGVQVPVSDLFGVQGSKLLAELQLPVPYRYRIDSLLRLMEAFDREIDQTTSVTTERLRQDPGFLAVQTIPGVGPILGAVFVAEIGDVHRFPEPSRLASWGFLTPKHYESDTTVHRGRITKQGSRLVRWAAVEAVGSGPRRAPGWRRCGTGSRPAAAATSAPSPRPANWLRWSSTRHVITTSDG